MELFKILGTIAINNSEAIKGLKDTTEEAESTSSKVSVALEKIGTTAVKVGKAMTVAMGAGVVALSALTKASLDAYAQYEQLIGGVNTLFNETDLSLEEYAKSVGKTTEEVLVEWSNLTAGGRIVANNAREAFRTAGLSANEYMETVTSFSASLIQSLEGDTVEASKKADMAIIDMADNANKMGTSIDMIQNAYQGFAKQNYTMLDNLKLGYGGTQEEMKRLLADAEKLSGIEYDISSYADVVDAIHVIQEEMGIAGATAEEASTTIQGSLASMKASWQNLLTDLATGEQEWIDESIKNFTDSVVTVSGNVLPRIQQIFKGIAELVKQLVPQITSMLPAMIEEVLPPLLEATALLIQGLADAIPDLLDLLLEVLPEFIELGVEIVDSILEGIMDNIGKMGTSATQIVVNLTTGILQLLPKFLEVGAKLIVSIIQGISQSLPQIIQTITSVALQLVDVLIQNLPLFIESGLQLIVSLTQGILDALPDLLAKMPEIIQQLVEALLNSIDLIIEAGVQLLTALVENLDEIINAIVAVLPQIITAIVTALTSEDGLASIIDAGVTLLTAIIDNIDEIITTIVGAIPALITAIFNAFTSEEALSSIADAGLSIIESLLQGLVDAWESVKSWATSAVQWLKDIFTFDLFGGFSFNAPTLPSQAKQGVTSALTNTANAGRTGSVSNGINSVASSIPKFAEGGIVDKATILMAGEAGSEVIMPLKNNTEWIDGVAQRMDSALGGKDTAQKLDKLIALQEAMLEIMPELANVSIQLNNREFGRAVRQVTV
jgi:phage-related protein